MTSEELDRLFRSTTAFLRCRDQTELTARITGVFCEVLGFDAGLLRLRSPEDDRFVLWATTGMAGAELEELHSWDLDLPGVEELLEACHRVGWCYLDEEAEGGRPRLYVPLLTSEQELLGLVELRNPSSGSIDHDRLRWGDRLAEMSALLLEAMVEREELAEASRELSTAHSRIDDLETRQQAFLDGVSHELRTPLTSIQAYCEGLLSQEGEMDEGLSKRFLHVILEESRRLNDRVEDLLAIARGDHAPPSSTRRLRFDLREVVREVHLRLTPILEEKHIQAVLDLPGQPVLMEGEREGIALVVQELMDNAVKFSPEGGRVVAAVVEDEGEVELRVEDSGEGIPESESTRIFERFYQVDGSTTRVHGGQGLGLSVCRRIVEEHEGRIWVERPDQGGALFRVRLPRQRAVLRSEMTHGVQRGARGELLELLDLSVAAACELMSCGIASIMTYDEKDACLRVQAAVGLSEEVVRRTRVEVGQGVAGRVYESGETVLIRDLREDRRFPVQLNEEQYDGYSVLSTPLRLEGKVVGVLNVNNKSAGEVFDDDDRLLLESLAERISVAFAHYLTFQKSHQTVSKAREALRAVVDVNHQRRTPLREAIVRCGLATARRDGADEKELRALSYALRVYDLGLSTLGDEFLGRTEPLGAGQRRRLEEHALRGADLSSVLEEDRRVQSALAHHHENWDGSGYPDGLAGESIPPSARIIRLVDCFAAMLHGRPARPPIDVDEAIALVEEALGRRFCPRLGALFLEEVRSRRDELVYLCRWQEENGPGRHESGPQWPRNGKLPPIRSSLPSREEDLIAVEAVTSPPMEDDS